MATLRLLWIKANPWSVVAGLVLAFLLALLASSGVSGLLKKASAREQPTGDLRELIVTSQSGTASSFAVEGQPSLALILVGEEVHVLLVATERESRELIIVEVGKLEEWDPKSSTVVSLKAGGILSKRHKDLR